MTRSHSTRRPRHQARSLAASCRRLAACRLSKSELAASEASKSAGPAAKGQLNFSERFARRTFGLGENREESERAVVVAQCVATPDAANDRFQKILRQRGLQWREGAVAESLDETKQFSLAPRRPTIEEEKSDAAAKSPEKYKTSDKYADASGGGDKSAAGRGEDGATKSYKQKKLGRQQDVAVFFVEASPEQIQAVIEDLQSQPHVYQKLTVSAAGSDLIRAAGAGAARRRCRRCGNGQSRKLAPAKPTQRAVSSKGAGPQPIEAQAAPLAASPVLLAEAPKRRIRACSGNRMKRRRIPQRVASLRQSRAMLEPLPLLPATCRRRQERKLPKPPHRPLNRQ